MPFLRQFIVVIERILVQLRLLASGEALQGVRLKINSAQIFHGSPNPVARPQTAANDDPDACTSGSPTAPASVAQRRCADAQCSPWARRLQTGRSYRTNACVPLPGSAHPGSPGLPPSAYSGATFWRSQTPLAL